MASALETQVGAPPAGGMEYSTRGAELDEEFYDPAETAWLSGLTGITDPEELKKHILQVQRDVYAIHPYPCIRLFNFVKQKISRFPIYQDLLRLGRERPGALFLDIGCGVGNDTRKAVLDGFPASQIIASDLHADFFDIGHRVFKSTPETFPVSFVSGNIFDDDFLAPADAPLPAADATPLDLRALTSLSPLRGRLSAIYASSFFHLFSEAQQAALAARLGALLAPTPGAFLFGSHIGRPEKGLRTELARPNVAPSVRMFCHSPDSWRELWEGVFGKDKVEVKAVLREVQRRDMPEGVTAFIMAWSVKRV